MPVVLKTALLLCISILFMAFAWYGHPQNLGHRAWYVTALANWGVTDFIPFGALNMLQPLKLDYPAGRLLSAQHSLFMSRA